MVHFLDSEKPKTEDVLASIRRAIETDWSDGHGGRAGSFTGIFSGTDRSGQSPEPRSTTASEPPLVSREAELRTQAAFSRLSEKITRQAFGGRPIGDAAQDYLRSAITQWLDDNLPALAERLVREEIQRVVRSRERR